MNSIETISVIIPTFRRLDLLTRALNGVYSMNKLPDQVIVVYRPEDDVETAEWLTKVASIKYTSLTIKEVFVPGQVAAINAGLDIATGDIVIVFDDDAIPRPDWSCKIIRHFNNPLVAVAGGRDVVYQHRPMKDATKSGVIDFWGNIIGNHHLIVGLEREVDVIKGCNFAIRHSAIGSLRFDERLLGKGAQHGNDYWLCLNFRHHNWKIILDPNAIVDHYPAEKIDYERNAWSEVKCYEHTHNDVAIRICYYPWHLKLRYIIYHIIVGSRNCPGFYFILHSLLKRPRSLKGQLIGGWKGFIHGWLTSKVLREMPPGSPNQPTPNGK